MANKKFYYYVCVFTSKGPVFVTSEDYSEKVAHWDKDATPKEFTMTYADDLALGLRLNGYYALTVKSHSEIDYQPYSYSRGDWEWRETV